MKTIDRKQLALVLLRVTLALLIAIHGWHRFIEGGVNDMGHGFENRGYPVGMLLAYTITGLEMFGTMVYAYGRLVFPLSAIYVFIYSMAIAVYHWPHGWFSSGTDADGCEYAVLLIVGFICVGMQHMPGLAGGKNPKQPITVHS